MDLLRQAVQKQINQSQKTEPSNEFSGNPELLLKAYVKKHIYGPAGAAEAMTQRDTQNIPQYAKNIPLAGLGFSLIEPMEIQSAVKRLQNPALYEKSIRDDGPRPERTPSQVAKDIRDYEERMKNNQARGILSLAERPAGPRPAESQEEYQQRRQAAIQQSRATDTKLIEDFIQKTVEADIRGYDFGAKAAKGIAATLQMALEFAATGGLAEGLSASARGGLTYLIEKHAPQLMAKTATRFATKAATRLAGAAAGAAGRTAALGLGIENTAQRQALSATGLTDKESVVKSFAMGAGQKYVENLSEVGGEGLSWALRQARLGRKLVSGVGQVGVKLTGGERGQVVRNMFKAAGYHGFPGELYEERLATTIQALTGLEDGGAGKDAGALERLKGAWAQDIQNLPVELVVLAVPMTAQGVLGGSVNLAGHVAGKISDKLAQRKLEILDREEFKKQALSPDGAGWYAAMFPDSAKTLAGMDNPSRSDFEAEGIRGWTAQERKLFSTLLLDSLTRPDEAAAKQQVLGGIVTGMMQRAIANEQAIKDEMVANTTAAIDSLKDPDQAGAQTQGVPEEVPAPDSSLSSDAGPEASTGSAEGESGFTLTDEWQEVPEGVAVPPGGEYKLDMQAGKTFARKQQKPADVDQKPDSGTRNKPDEPYQELEHRFINSTRDIEDGQVEKLIEAARREGKKIRPQDLARIGPVRVLTDAVDGIEPNQEVDTRTYDNLKKIYRAFGQESDFDQLGLKLVIPKTRDGVPITELNVGDRIQFIPIGRKDKTPVKGTIATVDKRGSLVEIRYGKDGFYSIGVDAVIAGKTMFDDMSKKDQNIDTSDNIGEENTQKLPYADLSDAELQTFIDVTADNADAKADHEAAKAEMERRKKTVKPKNGLKPKPQKDIVEKRPRNGLKPKKLTDHLTGDEKKQLDELKKQLRDQLGRVNTGFDPNILITGIKIGNLYAKAGVRAFAEWSKEVMDGVPETFVPYLEKVYASIRTQNPSWKMDSDDVVRQHIAETYKQEKKDGQGTDSTEGRSADTGSTGSQRTGGRPGIRTASEHLIPDPGSHFDAASYGEGNLDEHQILGINLALNCVKQLKSFLLGDGTGVGKTRQLLVIAAEAAKIRKKPSLIITKNKLIIKDAYTKDAKALGIDLDDIVLGTYDDLSAGKFAGKYGAVLFDEAHSLKNSHSKRSIAATKLEADVRIFATATPMDRPTGASYFLSHITGKPQEDVERMLGYKTDWRMDPETKEMVPYTVPLEGNTWESILGNLIRMRDWAIQQGQMIRREYPFYGQVEMLNVKMPDGFKSTQKRVFDYWQAKIDSAFKRSLKRIFGGKRVSDLTILTEMSKVDAIFNHAMNDIKAGKKVIFMTNYTGESKNPKKPYLTKGKMEVSALKQIGDSFVAAMAKKLKDLGIEFATIYGDGDKFAEMTKFQSGKVNVALASYKSGGTGINLDDTVGDQPRIMYLVTPEFSADVLEQALGRVSRRNTQSPAKVYVVMSDSISDRHRMGIINNKMRTLKSIQEGEDLDLAVGLNVGEANQDEAESEGVIVNSTQPATPAPAAGPHLSQSAIDGTPAETPAGEKLLKSIEADKKRITPRVGLRSITEFLADILSASMKVGRTQTTKKNPAHLLTIANLIRTRSGSWQVNFHELGHALSCYLNEMHPDWFKKIEKDLVALTYDIDSFASAHSAEEGVAELVRKYIVSPKALPGPLVASFEGILQQHYPVALKGIRDARRAYAAYSARPLIQQMSTSIHDKPKKLAGQVGTLETLMYDVLTGLFGKSAIVHRMIRQASRRITGDSAFIDNVDVAGVIKLMRGLFSPAYKSMMDLAAEYRKQITGTAADVRSAYQMLLHAQMETNRAIEGTSSDSDHFRVIAGQGGFHTLSEDEITALQDAGFEFSADYVKPGDWIRIPAKSIGAIRRAIGKANWEAFCMYGQWKTALHRWRAAGHQYPLKDDNLTPDKVRQFVLEAERDHPDWLEQYKEVNRYMDQMLLISLLSGQRGTEEIIRIKEAWEDYWPLPKQVEDKPFKKSSVSPEPSDGIKSAHGSMLPFRTLDEAILSRTQQALEAYYMNMMMNAAIRANTEMNKLKGVPFRARKEQMRLIVPMRLERKKVAQLSEEEQQKLIADFINDTMARDAVKKGQPVPAKIKAEDIVLTRPGGKPLWRMRKPNAVHVIAPFVNGRRRYYQVTDPILFDLFTKTTQPQKYIEWAAELLRRAWDPVKKNVTQNVPFTFINATRDSLTSFFMGDDVESMIPCYYQCMGLIARLKGEAGDLKDQAELLSRSIDHTNRTAHQTVMESFWNMLLEDVAQTDWRDMNIKDWIQRTPGIVVAGLMKPISIVNWITGGRYLAKQSETLSREGAYYAAKKKGKTEAEAIRSFDYITGNFGQRQGNGTLASTIRAAGFLNPVLQIMWGQAEKITDPDPKVRLRQIAMKLPLIMVYAGMASAINVLAICAGKSDDEKKQALDNLRERPDKDRLSYMALWGKIRLPFDYGILGSAASFGWNSVEEWLIADPIATETKAKELLRRARDLPMPQDFMNPYLKMGFELSMNHSFFFDDEIVPNWMERAYPYNPELRTWPSTSKVYNAIGQGLKVSPIMVEYAVKGLFSRQMDDAVNVLDAATGGDPYKKTSDLPLVGRMATQLPTGWKSDSVQSIQVLDDKWTALRREIDKVQADGGDASQLIQQRENLDIAHAVMHEVQGLWDQVKDEQKSQHPDHSKIDKLQADMRALARKYIAWDEGGRKDKLDSDILSAKYKKSLHQQRQQVPQKRQPGESPEKYIERRQKSMDEKDRANRVLSTLK